MTGPTLAVLMPVYNAATFLPAAIDSILAQSWRAFRFVIVDDGSTDSSAAIIARYAAADGRIVPLSKSNSGITTTLNFGLRQIGETYVARMDADDIALPERFARQIARLEADAALAALGTRVHAIDRAGRLRHPRPVITGAEALVAVLPFRNAISHPSAMFRRSALIEAGGYRERFKLSQDYDLWLRLSVRHRLDNLPETLLQYRTYEGRASSSRNRIRQTVYSVAAAADFFCRRYGLATDDAPIDIAEPSSVTAELNALLGHDLDPVDGNAVYRHSLRLIRNVPGRAVADLRRQILHDLVGRREYGQLVKLGLYSLSRKFRLA